MSNKNEFPTFDNNKNIEENAKRAEKEREKEKEKEKLTKEFKEKNMEKYLDKYLDKAKEKLKDNNLYKDFKDLEKEKERERDNSSNLKEKNYIKIKLGKLKSANSLHLLNGERKKDIAERYFESNTSLDNYEHLVKAKDRLRNLSNIANTQQIKEENLELFKRNRMEEFNYLRERRSNKSTTNSHTIIDYSLNKGDHIGFSDPMGNPVGNINNNSIISYINKSENERDNIIKEKIKIKNEKVKALIAKTNAGNNQSYFSLCDNKKTEISDIMKKIKY